MRLCCGPDFTHSSGIRQIENLATFLVPWVEKATSTSQKCRLLRNLGHFYHQMHYANRQSRGPLCQRAAAAFRGSVQDHQVLMSQERNQHTDITHFTLAQHTPQNYTCSTQVHLCCQLLEFFFFVFRGKAFNLHFTVSFAGNGNRMIKVMCLDSCKKGKLFLQTGCSTTSAGSVSVFAVLFSRGCCIINDNHMRIHSRIIVFFLSLQTWAPIFVSVKVVSVWKRGTPRILKTGRSHYSIEKAFEIQSGGFGSGRRQTRQCRYNHKIQIVED